MAVEYLLLAGCVALALVLGFQRFGGAVGAKVACQARSVLALSSGSCDGSGATGVDFAGVEIAGSAPAERERNCSGFRAITCRLSDAKDSVVDGVRYGWAFLEAEGKFNGAWLVHNAPDPLKPFAQKYVDFELHLTDAVAAPLKAVPTYFGLGGDGAPGVLESWRELTKFGAIGSMVSVVTDPEGFAEDYKNVFTDTFAVDTFKNEGVAAGLGEVSGNAFWLVLPTKVRVPKLRTPRAPHGSPAPHEFQVNPRGVGAPNCQNCVIATDATASGRPASAMPVPFRDIREPGVESYFGRKFQPAPGGRAEIEAYLHNAGPGSRVVVGGISPNGSGHVFNGFNENGKIRFIDGQSGLEASFDGYSRFNYIPITSSPASGPIVLRPQPFPPR